MREYKVDVKAFINIQVAAASEEEARKVADDLVNGNFSPSPERVAQLSRDLGVKFTTAGFEVDGVSEVEECDGEDTQV